ncbi:MAG: hypothetical protein LBD23_08945 [Oscillospiraceae bacterium]|nr:hypothetical protein [Oscillospiraceae bacterium]
MLKKSKRLISVLLAILMLLSTMSFTVFAIEENTPIASINFDEFAEIEGGDIEFVDEIYETGEVFYYNNNTTTFADYNTSSMSVKSSEGFNVRGTLTDCIMLSILPELFYLI